MAYRYFFALIPNAEACDATLDQALAVRAALGLRGNLVSRKRLHVTWSFVGTFDEPHDEVEAAAIVAGDALGCHPFDISFTSATSFGRGKEIAPCVFVGESAPMEMLGVATLLRKAMEDAGAAREDQYPFRPHITWLYSPDRIRGDLEIQPIVWRATELCLIRSTSGVPVYSVLKRWLLR
jgi:2'-5' RNA ligase